VIKRKARLISAKFLKRYLIAGLLVWIPLWATAVVIAFVVELLDKTVALLPDQYQPMNLIGINIPGIGIVISFVVLLLTGMIATNFLGEMLVGLGEKIVKRIPLVGSIHQAVKQVMQTIFSTSNQSFRKVLLVEYPRKGLWSIAFQTAATSSMVADLSGGDKITIFIPTTPNPTSGFLMLVDKSEVKELDISIDDALKMIISLGVVQPGVELPPLKKG
jgi:uncharacterized membrane protein